MAVCRDRRQQIQSCPVAGWQTVVILRSAWIVPIDQMFSSLIQAAGSVVLALDRRVGFFGLREVAESHQRRAGSEST